MTVHICQRCGTKFERRANGNEYKFCSHACNARRVIYNPEVLEMLAARGETAEHIAKVLGFAYGTAVVREMKRHGWFDTWRKARYKKYREAA
jgi:hypothetical protein